jgi:hypothetical protein|nr:MAG TPA: hypothetical protein [Caudoviricetes sp.]
MLHSPCKNCEERILHCHETCTKYLEYYEANENVKAERIKAKKERDLLFRKNKQRKHK